MENQTGKIPDGSCVCSYCSVEKNNSEFQFYKNRISPEGFRLRTNRVCRDCRRKTANDMKATIKNAPTRPEPPYPCDNCHKPIVTTKTLQLDHDHETQQFRGWLCKECNISIGNLGDNVKGMIQAAIYLNRTEKVLREEELVKLYERLS
jgi:hypothetical protein